VRGRERKKNPGDYSREMRVKREKKAARLSGARYYVVKIISCYTKFHDGYKDVRRDVFDFEENPHRIPPTHIPDTATRVPF